METLINFKDITELAIMAKFCRLFYNITGLILDINDIDGNHPKKYYSEDEENNFCKIIRGTQSGYERCILSGKESGIRTELLGKPDIYHCPAGLVDVSVPILIRGKHIATLSTGQVLFSKPTKKKFEVIKRNVVEYVPVNEMDKLEEAYFKTPVISKDLIMIYIELINLIVNYIFEVEEKIIFLKNNKVNPAITKAISYIEKNFHDKVYIKDVADHACVSKYYLEHIFKKETGVTFIEYLNLYRVSQAKKRLVERNISSACFETGFSSLSHFYKIFKKYAGVSPKGYKQNLQYLIKS